MIHFLKADLEYLLSPLSIRERTRVIFDYSLAGKTNFQVNLDKLNVASDYVYQVIREKYPDLKIPFHSRHGQEHQGHEGYDHHRPS